MSSNNILPQTEIFVDRVEIAKVFKLFSWMKNVTEIRVPGTVRGTCSGYVNNPDKAADEIEKIMELAKGVYFTPHEMKSEMASKVNNKIEGAAHDLTGDNDIAMYRLLLLDFDPERASGISSSNDEHSTALKRAVAVKDFLHELGFPEPVSADSGNGAHLLYFIELPNTKDNRELVKSVLKTLDAIFSDDKVKVDTSVYNPSRVWKLYGTKARKGESTPERPHRMSRILSIPDECNLVHYSLLSKVAGILPKGSKTSSHKEKYDDGIDNIESWLERNQNLVEIDYTKDEGYGKLYVLKRCPFNGEHTNKGCAHIIQFNDGGRAAGCKHNSCKDKGWADLVKLCDPEWKPVRKPKKDSGEKERPTDQLIKLIENIEMINAGFDEIYARVPVGDHFEVVDMNGTKFKKWLTLRYYSTYHTTISTDAINQVVQLKTSEAYFHSPRSNVYLRVAPCGDEFRYDLADDKWRGIRISAQGWGILDSSDVYFKRYQNTYAQVEPVRGGKGLDLLLEFINISNPEEKALLKVYVVSCLVPEIPHVIAAFRGSKGAAKSTAMRMIRLLVDPAEEELLTLSRDEDSLALSLRNNYMPGFDNISRISNDVSDTFCKAATGVGITKRKLYTDNEENLLKIKHCIMLNGINLASERSDLIDRMLIFNLNRVSDTDRKDETEIYRRFNEVRPYILASMFDTLSKAMRIYPSVKLKSTYRMADYTKWGYAIAEALGIGGDNFLKYYGNNRNTGNEEVIMNDPLAVAINSFISKKNRPWEGRVSELYTELGIVAQQEMLNTKAKQWPGASPVLTKRLEEIKSNLLEKGIHYEKFSPTSGKDKGYSVIRLWNENSNAGIEPERELYQEQNIDHVHNNDCYTLLSEIIDYSKNCYESEIVKDSQNNISSHKADSIDFNDIP